MTAPLLPRFLEPEWPVPRQVRAWVSLRSRSDPGDPFGDFNTANHVGDAPGRVAQCRTLFHQATGQARQPQWLQQIHGDTVVEAEPDGVERTGDACVTRVPGQICTLHTADCLPVFFCSRAGDQVALAHAGWRSLAAGVLEKTLACFAHPAEVVVWLGPAIGPASYQVGKVVYQAFVCCDPKAASAFQPDTEPDKWYCDLYALARQRLEAAGVGECLGGDFDTYTDPRFFSYRRNPVCGRILSALWIDPAQ